MDLPRVIHLSTVHHPHDTRILYRECGSLADNGYSVNLLICSPTPIETSISNLSITTFLPPRNRFTRMTSTAYSFLREAIKQNADIYHFHDPELAPWMLILRMRGKKVIFDVHENVLGSISDRTWIPRHIRPLIAKIGELFLPVLMKPFNIIFAERSYPSSYPWVKKHTIVCNFPKLEYFPQTNKHSLDKFENFSIVYVGSITEARGILTILDALAILKKQGNTIDFYLIGKSNLSKNSDLQKLIKERNLTNVHILGYTPQPEALKIVSRCHLGLAILLPVKNYVLSYPTKIFEYMGCNVPFVTSNFPLYQEIIDKWQCGVSVNPNDPEEVASKIKQLIPNLNKLEEMGSRGRQAVETEYNWENEEKHLLALYKTLS